MAAPAANPSPVAVAASATILLILFAMLVAWSWAIGRLWKREPLLPRARPRKVPWGLGTLLTLLIAWTVTQTLVVSVHYRITGRFGSPEIVTHQVSQQLDVGETSDEPPPKKPRIPWTDRDKLVITGGVALLFLPIAFLIVRSLAGATWNDLALTSEDFPRNVVRGLVACLLLAPVCYAINAAASHVWTPQQHDLVTMIRDQLTPQSAILAIVTAVILAPFFEEVAFRGILLPWLEMAFRSRRARSFPPLERVPEGDLSTPTSELTPDESIQAWKARLARTVPDPPDNEDWGTDQSAPWMANVLTSALFAGLHAAQWPAPIALFVLSIGLGVLVQRTGSLWAPIVMHACFNGLSTLALMLAILAGMGESTTSPAPATRAQVTLPLGIPAEFEGPSLIPQFRESGLGSVDTMW